MSAALEEYLNLFGEAAGGVQARKRNYATLSLRFYDLVTGFYEFAWGQSFHFAPRMDGENLHDSLARCQRRQRLLLVALPGPRPVVCLPSVNSRWEPTRGQRWHLRYIARGSG